MSLLEKSLSDFSNSLVMTTLTCAGRLPHAAVAQTYPTRQHTPSQVASTYSLDLMHLRANVLSRSRTGATSEC